MSNHKFWLSALVLFGIFTAGFSQVSNDECAYATYIPNINSYCSGDGAFTNKGATSDPTQTNNCVSLGFKNGVWFSFTATKPGVLIKVFGDNTINSIRNPKILVYNDCNSLNSCSPGKISNFDEIIVTQLTIGHIYYIMVESPEGSEGDFKLCIEGFIPVPFPESDCKTAVVLCDKNPFVVQSLSGIGNDKNEIESGNCISNESQSVWYKWTCDSAGTLTFTLTPNDFTSKVIESVDLDFALYELPNGIDDCSNKKLLRCMASGANLVNNQPAPISQWSACNGPTGLMIGDQDIMESQGCQTGNNNFVSAINMEVGKSYVLIVNNFDHDGKGFSIEFGGSGTFLGPEPDFEINANNAFECDKSVTVINTSQSQTDPISSYAWNFGDRATPLSSTGTGPFTVSYASFGDKLAALTVTSTRGCTVTKILEFYVNPCCKDTSTLDVAAQSFDVICFGEENGKLTARGISGAPEYRYSLDNGPYQPNPNFLNLTEGNYTIRVRDIKGCTDSILVSVGAPPPIVVNAGEDMEIELGDSITLFGDYFPKKTDDAFVWSPALGNPNTLTTTMRPVDNTTFTLMVTDTSGCTGEDMVEIRVVKNLNIYAPNVLKPGSSFNNGFFNVWGTKSVDSILLLEIYDRWGNLVFQGADGKLISTGNNSKVYYRNQYDNGWNGTFKGKDVVPGVYAWRALVLFLDGTEKNFAGDLTVLR